MPVRPTDTSALLEYDLAAILGLKPAQVESCLAKKPGDRVKKGELVAMRKGLKKRLFVSPVSGRIESFADDGTLKIKPADGKNKPEKKTNQTPERGGGLTVSSEIDPAPAKADLTPSGYGGMAQGELVFFEEELTVFDLNDAVEAKIVAFKGRLSEGVWYKSLSIGVSGVVCTGLPGDDFQGKLAREDVVPLLVVAESDELWPELKKSQGKTVKLDGEKKKIELVKG